MENRFLNQAAGEMWANLDYNILVKIFMTLSIMDLANSVSRVCTAWRHACYDPLLWGTIDMNALNFGSMNVMREQCALPDDQCSLRLLQMLNNALTLSCNSVTRLIFDFNVYIKDEHLSVAAERCPNLKQLVLPAWNHITAAGLCNAIEKLKGLESLTLPCGCCPPFVIEVIGRNCMNLTELKIMCPFDLDLATTLFVFIPKLKVLSLRCSLVYKGALNIILTLLQELEVLNISHSLLLDIPYTAGPFKFFWECNSSINNSASKLKNFFICQKDPCIMCKHAIKDLGQLKWDEYEEGLWREDEVSSLAV